MTTHVKGREYDVIFAGYVQIMTVIRGKILTANSGGTAACVAAGRLARADPNLSILLVEGGKNNYNDPTVVNPAMYLVHLAPGSQTALFYESNSEEALNGRKAIVPCGGILGGGSSINFMMYTRAQAVDFDDWETEGWSAKDLLPLMKRVCCMADAVCHDLETDQSSSKLTTSLIRILTNRCMVTMDPCISLTAHTSKKTLLRIF
jgi:alcohol oxidase